ncbi:MAG: alpha/beta hydrolase fold domain-containing protein [Verrucomicrobiota bacterium]
MKTLLLTTTALFTPLFLLAQSPFDNWDKNKDGKLSRDELPPQAQRNFDRADANGDGSISREEDQAFRSRAGMGNGGSPGKGGGKGGPEVDAKKHLNLSYADNDNPRQTVDLYLPTNATADEPLPLVCWIHGGGWRGGTKDNARRVLPFLESGNYAVASIGYRLTDEAQWPSQIQDCKAAIRFLKAKADKFGIDPDRIAVWGSSAGGHLVAMLGVANDIENFDAGKYPDYGTTSEVTCVVDYFGPTELLAMNEQGSKMDHDAANSPEGLLVGGAIQENQETAKDASPLSHVTSDDKPFLIVHGTEDPLVPHQQSVEFEEALEEVGVAATFVSVDGGAHGGGFPPETTDIVKEFIDWHLRQVGEPPEDQVLEAAKTKRAN